MWNVHVVNVYSRVYLLFQAEDGILDYKVTGVQTCALPIYLRALACERSSLRCDGPRPHHEDHKDHEDPKGLRDLLHIHRSEEHTSELQSPCNLVCRLLLEKKKKLTTPFLASAVSTSPDDSR